MSGMITAGCGKGYSGICGLGGTRAGVIAYKSKDLAHWDGPFTVFQIPEGK